jgi:hypothetical protein
MAISAYIIARCGSFCVRMGVCVYNFSTQYINISLYERHLWIPEVCVYNFSTQYILIQTSFMDSRALQILPLQELNEISQSGSYYLLYHDHIIMLAHVILHLAPG